MDPLAVVRAHLALELAEHVGHRTPSSTTDPWVQVHLLENIPDPRSRPIWLRRAHLQLDCYAGEGQRLPVATELAADVERALMDMPTASHDGAVVAGVKVTGNRPLADLDFEPPRDRVIVTATVTMRPTDPGS